MRCQNVLSVGYYYSIVFLCYLWILFGILNMPRHCCVPNCNSNYRTALKKGDKVISTFKFPPEPNRSLWINNIPRKDWTVTENTVVCIRHFKPECIDNTYQRPRIKEGGCPTIFPNCPSYLNVTIPEKRKSPKKRRLEFADRHETAVKKFLDSDLIPNFEGFCSNLDKIEEMRTWKMIIQSQKVWFYTFKVPVIERLEIGSEIGIHENMSVDVFVGKYYQDTSWILSDNKLSRWSQINNLLVRYEKVETPMYASPATLVNLSVRYLQQIDTEQSIIDLGIITNVLQLFITKLENKRIQYDLNMIVFSFCIHNVSAAAYEVLRTYMPLPTARHLRNLSNGISVSLESEDGLYLQRMCSRLNERERIVALLIDEIYVKTGLHYKAKKLVGQAVNNVDLLARTVQTFMISSCFGSYKDVVKLLPVKSMCGEELAENVTKIISGIQKVGFKVLCIITDNNRLNQKLFRLLSTNSKFFKNMDYENEKIFLLYDSVHLLKNIRNSWFNKKDQQFVFPWFNLDKETHIFTFKADQQESASVNHIRRLFHLEKNKIYREGNHLSKTSCYPSPTEKQNVNLALNIFHPTTTAALISTDEYKSTAEFTALVHHWWTIVNTKSSLKGIRKRDVSRPIFSSTHENVNFLRTFNEWLTAWHETNSKYSGLTRDTYLALRHTTQCLILITEYIFDEGKLNVEYLLYGKLQTDPLECQFGNYRKVAGTNYDISVVQVLESEKKIRIREILKTKDINFVNTFLKDAKKLKAKADDTNIDEIFNEFCFILRSDYLDTEDVDEGAYLMVVGYMALSIQKKTNNCPCVTSSAEIQNEYFKYLQRGGLRNAAAPIKMVFHHMTSIFQFILNDDELEKDFLKIEHHQELLRHLTMASLELDVDIGGRFGDKCTTCKISLREICSKACKTLSNITLNNYTKYKNNNVEISKGANKSKGKARKLDVIAG